MISDNELNRIRKSIPNPRYGAPHNALLDLVNEVKWLQGLLLDLYEEDCGLLVWHENPEVEKELNRKYDARCELHDAIRLLEMRARYDTT